MKLCQLFQLTSPYVHVPRGKRRGFITHAFKLLCFGLAWIVLSVAPGLVMDAFAQTVPSCKVAPTAVTLGTFDPMGAPGDTHAGGILLAAIQVSCPDGGTLHLIASAPILTPSGSGPCGGMTDTLDVPTASGVNLQLFAFTLSANAIPQKVTITFRGDNNQQVQGQFTLLPGLIQLSSLFSSVVGGENQDPSLLLATPTFGAAQVTSSNPQVAAFASGPQVRFQVPLDANALTQLASPGPLQVNAVTSPTTVTLNAVFRPCTTDFNSATAATFTDSLQITVLPEPIIHRMRLKINNLDGTSLSQIALRLVENFDGSTFFELDSGEYVGGTGTGNGGGPQHQNQLTLGAETYKLGQGWGVQIVPLQSDGSEGQPFVLTEAISNSSDQSDQNPADNSAIFSSFTELFAGQVLVHFPMSATDPSPQFFPVHSGTSTLTFNFTNIQNLTLTIPVAITTCTGANSTCTPQLGSTHPEFDTLLMQFADRNGIPPQILKAQIQQESSFNPNAFRYEPLSVDFAQIVAPTRTGTTPFGFLSQTAFASWALAESADCTVAHITSQQGARLDLASSDATARQRYSLATGRDAQALCRVTGANQVVTTRPINSSDTLPSMENVFYTNDGVAADWEAQAARNPARSDLRFYDYQDDHPPFTAQTVLASSYGLHQVMYATAVGEGYVDGQGVGLSPGNLFQPSVSLDLGTEYLAKKFAKSDGSEQTDYTDANDFVFQFAPALRAFNAGDRSVNFDISQAKSTCLNGPITNNLVYTCSILNNKRNFEPVPLTGGTGQ